MANASKIAKTNYVSTIIQEYSKKPAQIGAYNDRGYLTDFFIYPSQLAFTAVTGGTQTLQSTGQPKGADGDTIFSFDPSRDNRPLVASASQAYPRINVTAANAGALYTGAVFAVDNTKFFRALVRPSVAMTATFAIASSVGNSIGYTTPSALPANVWTPIIVPYSKFTTTGTFVATAGAKTIQVTGSAVGTLDFYVVEGAGTQDSFVGSKLNVQFDCSTELSMDEKRKIEKLMCYNFVDGTVASEYEASFKFKTKSRNITAYMMLNGETVVNQLTTRRLPFVANTIAAGTATFVGYDTMVIPAAIGQAWASMYVKFGELQLTPVGRIEEVLDYSTVFFDPLTGTFAFAPGEYLNRKPDSVNGYSQQTANTRVQRNLNVPMYASLNLGRLSGAVDKEIIAPKVQITDIDEKQDKGVVTYTYMITVLPVNINGDYVFFTESIA
jgi:hypothetical protein